MLPDTDAGRAVNEAVHLMQSHQLDAALERLEFAAKQDPKLPGVWSTMGFVYLMKGNSEQGLAGLERQTKETPDQALAFAQYVRVLLAEHKTARAVEPLKQWVELVPEDISALELYGQTLTSLKRHDEAAKVFTSALKVQPSNSKLRLSLGTTLLNLNQPDEAFAEYLHAVSIADDKIAVETEAALHLADHKVHMDQATEWAADAAATVEAQARTLSLDDLPNQDFRLMPKLAACWDELGWLHYLKGELAPAESYLKASWWLRQRSSTAQHLAQLYTTLQRRTEADHFRQFAATTADRSPEDGAADPMLSWKRGVWNAPEELSHLRLIRIPVASVPSASAAVMLLFEAPGESPAQPNPPNAGLRPKQVRLLKQLGASPLAEEKLQSIIAAIQRTSFALQPPDNKPVRILRKGILSCSPYTRSCDVALLNVQEVTPLNALE